MNRFKKIAKKLIKNSNSPHGIRGYRILGVFFDHNYITRIKLYDYIKRMAEDFIGGQLLDFGCGSKPYESLFDRVDQYVGVDIEISGHDHKFEKIDYFWDGKKLPFEDESFDYIISTEVFEHVFELESSLIEINRVMKTGGEGIFTVPFVWEEHEVPYDFGRYSSYGIKYLMDKYGFEVLELQKTTSYIESIFQMKNIYWEKVFLKAERWVLLRAIISIFFIFPINVTGILLGLILPKRDSLYLDNIVKVKKVR